MTENKKAAAHVSHILKILAEKIEKNPELIGELGLDFSVIMSTDNGKKKNTRLVELDSFSIYTKGGEAALRSKLDDLDLASLKNILDRHDFDPSQFAQKWKDKARLIDLIVKRVASQSKRKQKPR